VVDGPVPCCVVNHAASIAPSARLVLAARDAAGMTPAEAVDDRK